MILGKLLIVEWITLMLSRWVLVAYNRFVFGHPRELVLTSMMLWAHPPLWNLGSGNSCVVLRCLIIMMAVGGKAVVSLTLIRRIRLYILGCRIIFGPKALKAMARLVCYILFGILLALGRSLSGRLIVTASLVRIALWTVIVPVCSGLSLLTFIIVLSMMLVLWVRCIVVFLCKVVPRLVGRRALVAVMTLIVILW